jgi:fibronectin-binding autotransporter adhesin
MLVIAICYSSDVALAQINDGRNMVWTGSGGDWTWSATSGNWSGTNYTVDPSGTQTVTPGTPYDGGWKNGYNAIFNAETSGTITVSGSFNVGAAITGTNTNNSNNNYMQVTGTYVFQGDPLYFTTGADEKIWIKGAGSVVTFNNQIMGGGNSFYVVGDNGSLVTFTGGIIASGTTASGRGNAQLYIGNYSSGTAVFNGGSYYSAFTNVTQNLTVLGNTYMGVQQLNIVGSNNTLEVNSAGVVIKQVDNTTINANIIGQSNNSGRLWLRQGLVNFGGGVVVMAANNTGTNTGSLLVDGGTLSIQGANLTLGYASAANSNGNAAVTLNGGLTQVKGIAFGAVTGAGTFSSTTSASLIVNGGTLAIDSNGITKGALAMNSNVISLNGGVIKAVNDFSIDATLPLTLSAANGGITFDTNSKTITVNSALAGSGKFTKTGAGTLLLNAVNSYSGDAVISAGKLQLAAGSFLTLGDLTFVLNGSTTGEILGAGTLNLTNIIIDTTNAAAGSSWTLFDTSGGLTLSGFTVSGWSQSGNIWTSGDGNFTFDTTTGIVNAIPEPSVYALFLTGMVGILCLRCFAPRQSAKRG